MSEVFDYIIVGAGSAGCVLADRLSRDGTKRVLVLEAGGEDGGWLIEMPKGIGKLVLDPKHVWVYPVEQPRADGLPATEAWIRGRGLGGSSSINGMIYIRGQAEDYDEWVRRGATGWSWETMKQAYKAIEDHELGAGDDRGVGGPLHISTGKVRYPFAEACIEAGREMGLTVKQDLNALPQEGIGYYPHNIKNGRRESAAKIFLRPARARPNVRVETGIEVDRLLFEGRRVVGVAARRGDQPVEFRTQGEVIVSGGTVNSPKLLQLSGIGDGKLLKSLGIDVVVDNPHVGAHMLEHLGFSLPHRLKGGEKGINYRYSGLGLAMSLAQYYLTRGGPLAGGPFEVGAFVRCTPEASRPNAQLFLSGFTFARNDDPTFPVQLSSVEKTPGMTLYAQLLNLSSEGSLAISSADPKANVSIKPNWLSTEHDRRAAIGMFRYMRRFMTMPALADVVGEEIVPGPSVQTDEEILNAYKHLSMCGLHGVGTCRMGAEGEAVVDSRTRVHGVQGLRVVDCSIMPGLISGNTNAPAMATGWNAANLIQADRNQ